MNPQVMKISVFGLGYVGCVSTACLARDGHTVVGVDVSPSKVEALTHGTSPIMEPGLAPLLAAGVENGRIRATLDVVEAVRSTDVALVCVGTPSSDSGAIDIQYVQRVSEAIGQALRGRTRPFTVLVRSTVVPGTTQAVVRPAIHRAAGDGVDVRCGFHPEFLREATAIVDYDEPARAIVGCEDDDTARIVRALYPRLNIPVVRVRVRLAELLKYIDNAFHALKVTFANEVGAICDALEVDGRELMSLFVQDHKLNISPTYLKPGAPFGGSCLPKDLRALTHLATAHSVETVLLRSVLASNEVHKDRVFNAVRKAGSRVVAVLGLSFKHATDDLRESPAVELVERLIGKGYEVRIFDPIVRQEALVGSNLSYIQRELPHVERLLRDSLEETIVGAGVVVITKFNPAFETVRDRLTDTQSLVDIAGALSAVRKVHAEHLSVCS